MAQGTVLIARKAETQAYESSASAAPAPTSPLRVAVVTTFYPPSNFGGDGNYIRNWVHSLARRGCEVEVVYDADAWRVGKSALNPPPAPARCSRCR